MIAFRVSRSPTNRVLISNCLFALAMACLLIPYSLQAQPISESDYIAAALAANPTLAASSFRTDQAAKLEGTAYSIPSPIINVESPTGDFYTVGVSQPFRLPGFYAKQKKLLRSQTQLAQSSQYATKIQVIQKARMLYLDAQHLLYINELLAYQDSLYQALSRAASRLYTAGVSNALQASFATSQYEELHAHYLSSQSEYTTALKLLCFYSNLPSQSTVPPLTTIDTSTIAIPAMFSSYAPSIRIAESEMAINKQLVSVEKARFKPTFSLGYFNQSFRTTPELLRYRATVDIPIFTRQFRASIGAATLGQKAASRNLESAQLAFTMDSTLLVDARTRTLATIKVYQRILLPRSEILIAAALRLQTSGQYDIISQIRSIAEAFEIKLRYADLSRQYRDITSSAQVLAPPQ
jgi:outer membrane protein, heavy metal efflux system